MIESLIILHLESKVNEFSSSINWRYLSHNPKLKWDFIKSHVNEPWDWNALTSNPVITLDIIKNNKNLQWNYSVISTKNINNLGWDFLIDNIDKNWVWSDVCNNKIPLYILQILDNKNKPLDWYRLTDLYSDDEIRSNIYLKWEWYKIFRKRNKESLETIFKDIENIPEELLNEILHKSRCNYQTYYKIPWNLIIKCHNHNHWNWVFLSSRNDLSLDCLMKYPQKKWNWKIISENPIITWEFVSAHKNLPWDYGYLSKNLYITFDIINKNPINNWRLDVFQCNPNFLLSEKDLIEIVKKNHNICIIQRAWRKCNTDPEYKVCKNRLIREHSNLIHPCSI
jgi:hypothetical protein